jgi:hypothetical protein
MQTGQTLRVTGAHKLADENDVFLTSDIGVQNNETWHQMATFK